MRPHGSTAATALAVGIAVGLASSAAFGASLVSHPEVTGQEIAEADVRREGGPWAPTAWDDLSHTTREPGRYEVRERAVSATPGDAIQIPSCAGRAAVRVDSRVVGDASRAHRRPGGARRPRDRDPGRREPLRAPHRVRRARSRSVARARRPPPVSGSSCSRARTPHAAGARRSCTCRRATTCTSWATVLVGLHPVERRRSGRTRPTRSSFARRAPATFCFSCPAASGNSLYTADAEDEVLRAIDALASVVIVRESLDSVHALHVSIWGASMGGAGATTIAFHHPDRFAGVTSFFGDSKYDLSTYVRSILVDERAAHMVNALDVVDNARSLPVRLIHGEDDATSPIRQSEILATALQQRGYPVRFDRVPGVGHSGALVARFLPEVVADAAQARTELPAAARHLPQRSAVGHRRLRLPHRPRRRDDRRVHRFGDRRGRRSRAPRRRRTTDHPAVLLVTVDGAPPGLVRRPRRGGLDRKSRRTLRLVTRRPVSAVTRTPPRSRRAGSPGPRRR